MVKLFKTRKWFFVSSVLFFFFFYFLFFYYKVGDNWLDKIAQFRNQKIDNVSEKLEEKVENSDKEEIKDVNYDILPVEGQNN